MDIGGEVIRSETFFSEKATEICEYCAIYLMVFTVVYEAFEITRKYVEDIVLAYKRGKKEGKTCWNIFFSNESDTLLLENFLG